MRRKEKKLTKRDDIMRQMTHDRGRRFNETRNRFNIDNKLRTCARFKLLALQINYPFTRFLFLRFLLAKARVLY